MHRRTFLNRRSQTNTLHGRMTLRTGSNLEHRGVALPDADTALGIEDQVSVALANEAVRMFIAIGLGGPHREAIGIVSDAVSVSLHLHPRHVLSIDGPGLPFILEPKLDVAVLGDSEFVVSVVGDERVTTTDDAVLGEGRTVGILVRHGSC
ncbi:hypothetical protein E1B28_001911 [Marasmius oreades]|uniref:Uncharacterized protein n=1 Tax=Marasmius oreades TaxID=181124 RepID=A0A9P7V4D5_9AGAR|nr:uncharacterized protein E1B28_001911 [Marasmius oreades]KAG7100131.1 hypothetical protein E1B28_001911 [Marasmius oreades]